VAGIDSAEPDWTRRRALLGGVSLLTLSGCSGLGGLNLPDFNRPTTPLGPTLTGQTIGSGPVQVALLLPLSGDPSLSKVATSMQNGAILAMEFVASNPNMTDNITLAIKDSGSSAQGAAAAASQAVAEGASLILGPLKADQVTAAGGVARSAGIPLIGFSNNSGAAQPGVYLLNVLPESEVKRSLGYARSLGKQALAGIFPNNDFGRIQQSAFQQAAADLGLRIVGMYTFGSETEARSVIAQVTPTLNARQADTLFLPDRATAPSFGVLLQDAKVPAGGQLIVGSADWNNDPQILATPYLNGAIYPALDDKGYQAILPQYQQRFGEAPHPLVTVAYTAVILANASTLSQAQPKYNAQLLTAAGGFNGRDGVFRFLSDGRSQYALVIKKISNGAAAVVDGAKL
jgi:ABC-type branched-subunit amino acid transport system substrate-binding protein